MKLIIKDPYENMIRVNTVISYAVKLRNGYVTAYIHLPEVLYGFDKKDVYYASGIVEAVLRRFMVKYENMVVSEVKDITVDNCDIMFHKNKSGYIREFVNNKPVYVLGDKLMKGSE